MEDEQAILASAEFLAILSHELKSPLTVIMGLSEALQEGVYGPLTPKQAASLKTIEDSGKKLLTQLSNLVDLSRIDTGKLELDLQKLNIKLCCEQAIARVRSRVLKNGQTISFSSDGLMESVLADRQRVGQILDNLLDNAVKHLPQAGEIQVTATGLRDEAMGLVSVWHDGPAFPQDKVKLMLNPLMPMKAGERRRYEGGWLSLLLVRMLAELHGGRLDVQSEQDKGTRYTVSLPLAKTNGGGP
jgi:signal transduction histidine kinase